MNKKKKMNQLFLREKRFDNNKFGSLSYLQYFLYFHFILLNANIIKRLVKNEAVISIFLNTTIFFFVCLLRNF